MINNSLKRLLIGKLFWDTDGPVPKQVIASLKIKSNGEIILIPNSAFDDLYEPNLNNLSVCFGPENTIYISMLNSDGAGAYTIVWIIKNNNFYKRYIDNSEA